MDQDQSEVTTIHSTVLFPKSPVTRITGVANQRHQSVVAHFIPQQSNPTQKIKAAPCLQTHYSWVCGTQFLKQYP